MTVSFGLLPGGYRSTIQTEGQNENVLFGEVLPRTRTKHETVKQRSERHFDPGG